jgi:hypothetical protein
MEMLMGVSERPSIRLSDPRTELNDFTNLMGALQFEIYKVLTNRAKLGAFTL